MHLLQGMNQVSGTAVLSQLTLVTRAAHQYEFLVTDIHVPVFCASSDRHVPFRPRMFIVY